MNMLAQIVSFLKGWGTDKDDAVLDKALDKSPDGRFPIKGEFYHDTDHDGPDDTDPSGFFVGVVDINQFGHITGTYEAGPHQGTFEADYVDPWTIDGVTDTGIHFNGTRDGDIISGVIPGIGYWHGDYMLDA